MSAHTVFTHGD